jgi:probable HAF family extracellular repeat protein
LAQAPPFEVKDLGTLGGRFTQAVDINDAGLVTGYSEAADGQIRAFVYSNGRMRDLGSLGGGASAGNAINEAGIVTGFSTTSAGEVRAFRYVLGLMLDLGTVSGSFGKDINLPGVIAGEAIGADGQTTAIKYSLGVQEIQIPGASFSTAEDINDLGQIAGRYEDASGSHAFVAFAGHVTDLFPGRTSFVYGLEAGGGRAHVAVVDALDEVAVRTHVDRVVGEAGRIDVAFTAVGADHVQGRPLRELSLAEFREPITTLLTSQFLVASNVARHMAAQRSGVVLTLSTTAARVALPSDGFGPACAGVEALTRQLAGELGPFGVRVVCLRPDGMPETAERGSHAHRVWERAAATMGRDFAELPGAQAPLLGRPPAVQEVAETAAFLASDRAGAITGAVVNLSTGSVVD